MLISIDQPKKGYFDLKKWNTAGWMPGHSWEMSLRPAFRVLNQMAVIAAPVKVVVAPAGVCCKRCHALNGWAEPNQKDGSYLCFECRT